VDTLSSRRMPQDCRGEYPKVWWILLCGNFQHLLTELPVPNVLLLSHRRRYMNFFCPDPSLLPVVTTRQEIRGGRRMQCKLQLPWWRWYTKCWTIKYFDWFVMRKTLLNNWHNKLKRKGLNTQRQHNAPFIGCHWSVYFYANLDSSSRWHVLYALLNLKTKLSLAVMNRQRQTRHAKRVHRHHHSQSQLLPKHIMINTNQFELNHECQWYQRTIIH
jgi:hypothetical protein